MVSRLWPFAAAHRWTAAQALALLLVTTSFDTVVVPLLLTVLLFTVIGSAEAAATGPSVRVLGFDLGATLDGLLGSHDRVVTLLAIAAASLALILVKCVCEARRLYLAHRFGFLVARDLRQKLFDHLVGQSAAFYEREQTGALLSRIIGDVVLLQDKLGSQLFESVQAPLAVLIGLVVMIALNFKLTLATLCLAPIIAFALTRAGRVIRRLTVARHDRLAALNAYLAERLAGVRTIQSFGREQYEIDQVSGLNEAYYRDSMRSVLVAEAVSPASEFVAVLGMMAGLLLGGLAVLRGEMPREHFVLFFTVAPMASTHVARLARVSQIRQQIAGATARVFALLDTPPVVRDAPGARRLPTLAGRVTFDAVTFHYGNGHEALSGVSLEVAPGETVALVGPSGAGKTTLVNLVIRFFDPTEGRVLVDGHDLREVTLSSLRAQIGVVSQDVLLFSRSVRENIRYGRLDASDLEVETAAEVANALEFIAGLPGGFDTVLGERGLTLSGGQRQRIAIARALLKAPRILVLDEATSALDAESERLVQQAIDRLVRGRTTFVIAHRLSTVQHAARVVVLDRGRIVEAGGHADLLERSGLYRRLHDLQFGPGRSAGLGVSTS